MAAYKEMVEMLGEEGIDVVSCEDSEMSAEAQEIDKALRKLSLKDRADAILNYMAHDGDVMTIVRGRMNWELFDYVDDMNIAEGQMVDTNENAWYAAMGRTLFKEGEDVMQSVYIDDYNDSKDMKEILLKKARDKVLMG